MAKEFGVLPSAAARDLDRDPEQLSLQCVELLRYAEAKAAYDTRDKGVLKAWAGNRMMKIIEEYEAARALEEIDAREGEA